MTRIQDFNQYKQYRRDAHVDVVVGTPDSFVTLQQSREGLKGVFGTAPQTLLHKLHRGAAPQKTGVCGVPL